jgi:hypothetical protein
MKVEKKIVENVETTKVDKRVDRNIDRRNRREAVKTRRLGLIEKIIQKLATSPEEIVDQVGEILRSGSVVRNFKGKNLVKTNTSTVWPQTGRYVAGPSRAPRGRRSTSSRSRSAHKKQ